jgi:hypothetical protein
MGVTAPEAAAPQEVVPAPVAAVEAKVEAVAPTAIKPEVDLAEQEFNAVFGDTAAKGKAAGEALEAKEPVLTGALQDIEKGDVAGVVNVAPALVKEFKAGYKTTEFWLVAAGLVLTQLGAIHVPGKYGTTIQDSALIASYAISRGIAKSG